MNWENAGGSNAIDVPDRELKMVSVPIQPATYRLATSLAYDTAPWPHCTAAGKVILGFLPLDELEQFLAKDLPASTPSTITDPQMLAIELREIRRRGDSTNFEEQELGLVAEGSFLNGSGKVIAALSIGGPSTRMKPKLQEIVELVVETANRISFDLGFSPFKENQD